MAEQLSEVESARKAVIEVVVAVEDDLDALEQALIHLATVDPAVIDDNSPRCDGVLMREYLRSIENATNSLLLLITSLFGRARVAELFAGELDA